MENMKNKKSLVLIALLLLVGATSGYVASTYAKYTTTIEGNEGTAIVAAWNFENDNKEQTIAISLAETVDATTLINNRIAPGTSGTFDIELVNTSEVGVNFDVVLKNITNKPTNLKFYEDSAHTTEIKPGETEITGQLMAKDSTGVTIPVYWVWNYETENGDTADTENGKATEENRTLTIGVDITGTQVAPSETVIESHVD